MARIVPVDGWPTCRLKNPDTKRPKRPVPEHKHSADEAHLRFIRKLPCLITGRTEGIDAAHLRWSEASMSKVSPGKAKPADEWVVPLQHDVHMEQHQVPEQEFWARHNINPLKIAQRLYGVSLALRASKAAEDEIVRAMTVIVRKARSEAGMVSQ